MEGTSRRSEGKKRERSGIHSIYLVLSSSSSLIFYLSRFLEVDCSIESILLVSHSLGMVAFIYYRSGCCQIPLSQNILSPTSGNCPPRAKAKSRGKQAYGPKKGRIKMDPGNKVEELSDKLSSTCPIAGLCMVCW